MTSLNLNHVAVAVPDLEEAVRWYAQVLGFRETLRTEVPELGLQVVYLGSGSGTQIELYKRSGSASATGGESEFLGPRGLNHIGFLVEDVDRLAADFKAQGVPLLIEPTDTPQANVRTLVIQAPGGAFLEFNQPLK